MFFFWNRQQLVGKNKIIFPPKSKAVCDDAIQLLVFFVRSAWLGFMAFAPIMHTKRYLFFPLPHFLPQYTESLEWHPLCPSHEPMSRLCGWPAGPCVCGELDILDTVLMCSSAFIAFVGSKGDKYPTKCWSGFQMFQDERCDPSLEIPEERKHFHRLDRLLEGPLG